MKIFTSLCVAAALMAAMSACTTVEERPVTSTTTTEETHAVHTPVAGVGVTTTETHSAY